jgi:catechol 2,3-dioxygenase-like lactoylglutathione lyase family enzyme
MPDSVAQHLDQAIKGIGYVVIEVGDAAAAGRFYAELLGFAPAGRDRWPGAGRSATLAAPSGQHLVLAESRPRNDPRLAAAHQAYRIDPAARVRIEAARQADLHDYREDRPSEAADRVYLDDPWGNRIQLVAGADRPAGIDHVAIETNNILWAREFYGTQLGLPIEHRVGWKTLDYLNAKSRGEAAMAEAMPGSRYWNERYSKFETERRMLRPNVQLYFSLGDGTSLAVYLATRLYQAPLDSQATGTPLLGLTVDAARLADLAAALQASGLALAGPALQEAGLPIAASLHVRDPGGNFLAFASARAA